MRRNRTYFKICSVLVALCYLLSVSGLNVHSDIGCGKIYLTMLAGGTECSDVHPHSHCHDCGGHECCRASCGSCAGESLEDSCHHCINESFVADNAADCRDSGDVMPMHCAQHTREYPLCSVKGFSSGKAHPVHRPGHGDILRQCCISRT